MKIRKTFATAGAVLAVMAGPALADTAPATPSSAQTKLASALVAGAAVRSSDGANVGTVKNVAADGTVTLEGSDRTFGLPKDVFTTDSQGLVLKITAQQLADALSKTAPAAKSAAPSPEPAPTPSN